MKYPIGLTLLLITSFLVPIEFGTGTQTTINPTVIIIPLLICAWILKLLLVPGSKLPQLSKSEWILLIFAVSGVFSLLVGQLLIFNVDGAPLRAQIGGLAILFMSVGIFLFVANQGGSTVGLTRLTWVFLLIAALVILLKILPSLSEISERIVVSGATGSMFWLWTVALSFAQVSANRKLHRIWKLGLSALVVSVFYITFFQQRAWTSSWLPALFAILLILWLTTPKIGVLITLVALLYYSLDSKAVINLVMVGDNYYSLSTRLQAWEIITGLASKSPLFGLGPANYYWYASSLPIAGWYVNFSSHNNYVDLYAQFGIIGLGLFIWFAVEIGLIGLRLLRVVSDDFSRSYIIGALAGLGGTLMAGMLGDWFMPFVYNIGFAGTRSSFLPWFFLAGILVIKRNLYSEIIPGAQDIEVSSVQL